MLLDPDPTPLVPVWLDPMFEPSPDPEPVLEPVLSSPRVEVDDCPMFGVLSVVLEP